jgi:hypothetical protein
MCDSSVEKKFWGSKIFLLRKRSVNCKSEPTYESIDYTKKFYSYFYDSWMSNILSLVLILNREIIHGEHGNDSYDILNFWSILSLVILIKRILIKKVCIRHITITLHEDLVCRNPCHVLSRRIIRLEKLTEFFAVSLRSRHMGKVL